MLTGCMIFDAELRTKIHGLFPRASHLSLHASRQPFFPSEAMWPFIAHRPNRTVGSESFSWMWAPVVVEASTSRHFLFLYKANSIEVGHEGFLHLIHQLLGEKSLLHVTRMLPILYISSFESPSRKYLFLSLFINDKFELLCFVYDWEWSRNFN